MSDNNPDVMKDMNLLYYPPDKNPALIHPLVLAYVGDAIFELFIRQVVVAQPNQRPNYLHHASTRFVSAKAQSKALEKWLPLLTEEEQDVVRRGRNAKSGSIPKNADVLEYRHSTAMECLIGYLHYKGEHVRLRELLNLLLL